MGESRGAGAIRVLFGGLAVCATFALTGSADAPPAERLQQPVLPAGIEDFLIAREYWASESGDRLQAPNRGQNLRTYFESHGIAVVDRTAAGSPRLIELALRRFGRESALADVAPGDVHAEASRVEIRRPGLVEWFENRPEGLEQGFTVAERPGGAGRLVFELALSGARATRRGDGLVFETNAGRKLTYTKLVAWDANGEKLEADFAPAEGDRVAIAVTDTDARYPITVDPLLASSADTVLLGAQAVALFGQSVASAGDVNGDGFSDVIVGTDDYDFGPSSEGGAFIFHGSAAGVPDGTPTGAEATVTGSFGFGSVVASAGDVNGDGYDDVIVGAPDFVDAPDDIFGGAAFIFHGGPSGITSGPLTSADSRVGSQNTASGLGFGRSVASAGDVNGDGFDDIIVGDPEVNDHGAAYIFHGGNAGIANTTAANADTTLEGNQNNSGFGDCVASAGDVNGDGYADVLVGAIFYEFTLFEGAAFAFLGSASGVADATPANAHARFESDDPASEFGGSLASAGDVNGDGYSDIIIGSPAHSVVGIERGSAFVWLGGAGGLSDGDLSTAHARFDGVTPNSRFGDNVSSAGDLNGDGYSDIVIGGFVLVGGQLTEYDAYVFLGGSTGFSDGVPGDADAVIEVSDNEPPVSSPFGGSVASAGDVNRDGFADLIVGARAFEGGLDRQGGAFIYHGGSSGIVDASTGNASARLEGGQAGALFGASVAYAGDVNGDRYGDIIVGASSYDAGQVDEGAAFVFEGSATGITPWATALDADAELQGDQIDAGMGTSVAAAGDVNGDGYGDVIVGAPQYDNGEINEGAAFIFLGSSSGVVGTNPSTAHAQLESDQLGANLGTSVAFAGDTNGDGYGDVLAGAYTFDNGQTNEGAAFLFQGGPLGIADGNPGTAQAQLESNQAEAWMGYSAASAGDVNGDGFADVIVGARRYDQGSTNEGAAFLFYGSATGIVDGNPTTTNHIIQSNQVDAELGRSVASAGDVNGDGYADVIVGASAYDAGLSNEGQAMIFLGSVTGLIGGSPPIAHARLQGNQANAAFGFSVATAGDVNSDGFADVVVGAPQYDNGSTNEGAAFVFLGSASGITHAGAASAAAMLEGNQTGTGMGYSVSTAGDVNGDGFADIAVAANAFDSGPVDDGGVFVFIGGGTRGRLVAPSQYQISLAPPIASWGGVFSDAFVVSLRTKHPEGRGVAKLRVEWCPPGVAFGHATCSAKVSSSWTDTNQTGVTIFETINGLSEGVLYRWRARALWANASVTEPGIASPAYPQGGPWRRLQAQAVAGDLRSTPSDFDFDGDGVPFSSDNCPYEPNSDQSDVAGVIGSGAPDGIGDVCQCGDAQDDGAVDAADLIALRRGLTFSPPLDAPGRAKCSVAGRDSNCDVLDFAVLRRALNRLPPDIAPVCAAAVP